ncbi:MAG: hypothetical protein ABI240_09925 [Sphingomonas sp.]
MIVDDDRVSRMRIVDLRQQIPAILVALAVPPFIGGFLARPYIDFVYGPGSMVRPHMVHVVFVLEGAAIALLLMACALRVYAQALRWNWKGTLFLLGALALVVAAGVRVHYARKLVWPTVLLTE